MTIQIVRPSWSREMKMKTWSRYRTIGCTYHRTGKDAGTVFLKRDKEVWNWVPAIRTHHQDAAQHDVAKLDGYRLYQR